MEELKRARLLEDDAGKMCYCCSRARKYTSSITGQVLKHPVPSICTATQVKQNNSYLNGPCNGYCTGLSIKQGMRSWTT